MLAAMFAAAACFLTLHAEEVSLDDAKDAVRGWLALRGNGGSISDGRTVKAADGAPFHVVMVAGGGFVVTAADTETEPVTAFSTGDNLDEDPRNPFYALMLAHARARSLARAAETNSAAQGPRRRMAATVAIVKPESPLDSLEDMRVAPLVQSEWSQQGVGGYLNTTPCYNYYTPSNWHCGCVATAGAQIMRFFEFPASDTTFAVVTNEDCAIEGVPTPLATRGGSFNWADMPLVPPSNTTEVQRRAIGHLCYDVGVLCGMWYTSEGGSALVDWLARTFRHYGYSNAVAAYAIGTCSDLDILRAAVSNLDAGLPVAMGVMNSSGTTCHCIVGDGYGYSDGSLYLHVNMGWSGDQTAWYAPPDFSNDNFAFTVLDSIVYNVYTNEPAGGVICSGRVLAQDGETPVAGAVVTARGAMAHKSMRTNARGTYAFVMPPGEYAIEAAHGLRKASTTVVLVECSSSETKADGYFLPGMGKPVVGNLCDQDLTLSDGKGFFITVQ